jgi:hypothetical protein
MEDLLPERWEGWGKIPWKRGEKSQEKVGKKIRNMLEKCGKDRENQGKIWETSMKMWEK